MGISPRQPQAFVQLIAVKDFAEKWNLHDEQEFALYLALFSFAMLSESNFVSDISLLLRLLNHINLSV